MTRTERLFCCRSSGIGEPQEKLYDETGIAKTYLPGDTQWKKKCWLVLKKADAVGTAALIVFMTSGYTGFFTERN
jgi:hypothetical protein